MSTESNTAPAETTAPHGEGLAGAAGSTTTPLVDDLLGSIFDERGWLDERNAPEKWVKLARKLERENAALRSALQCLLDWGIEPSELDRPETQNRMARDIEAARRILSNGAAPSADPRQGVTSDAVAGSPLDKAVSRASQQMKGDS